MTRLDTFAVGAGLGALSVIACLHLGARIAGRHILEIAKENR